MIHTDGRPTIANCGPVPGADEHVERRERLEQLARDLAAAYGCSVEDAVKALTGGAKLEPRWADLAGTLVSDHPALD